MKSGKPTSGKSSNRNKITIAVFAIVLLVILWQLYGLFKSSGSPSVPQTPAATARTTTSTTTTSSSTTSTTAQPGQPGVPPSPVPSALPSQAAQATSPAQMQMLQLQQATQAQYLAALNELQMLKVNREIAETNQAIAAAQLAKVTAEKNIVKELAPQTPPPTASDYAKGLTQATQTNQQSFTVISVSQLSGRWSAVLGYQGNLYNIRVGDVLPADGSKVIAIDQSGVVLKKNDETVKVSLVPII